MYYHQIIKQDTANGIGIRQSLFVSGCNLNCKGCHNKKGQDFSYGWKFDKSVMDNILKEFNRFSLYDGLSILGGEPFATQNISLVTKIAKTFKSAFPDKTLWIYTGHLYEELICDPESAKLISMTDILVDGPFIEDQKDITLSYRGSSNQRLIDVAKTREQHKIVLFGADVKHTGM
jgi:anaerobic ribonucleoside-triphosphate reductase activating protein